MFDTYMRPYRFENKNNRFHTEKKMYAQEIYEYTWDSFDSVYVHVFVFAIA